MDKNNNGKKRKKRFNIKNMGVNIDKNEYYEIVLSNSARPDETYKQNLRGD